MLAYFKLVYIYASKTFHCCSDRKQLLFFLSPALLRGFYSLPMYQTSFARVGASGEVEPVGATRRRTRRDDLLYQRAFSMNYTSNVIPDQSAEFAVPKREYTVYTGGGGVAEEQRNRGFTKNQCATHHSSPNVMHLLILVPCRSRGRFKQH